MYDGTIYVGGKIAGLGVDAVPSEMTDLDVQWLERKLNTILAVKPPAETAKNAALVAALIADRDRQSPKRAASARDDRRMSPAQDGWLRAARREGLR